MIVNHRREQSDEVGPDIQNCLMEIAKIKSRLLLQREVNNDKENIQRQLKRFEFAESSVEQIVSKEKSVNTSPTLLPSSSSSSSSSFSSSSGADVERTLRYQLENLGTIQQFNDWRDKQKDDDVRENIFYKFQIETSLRYKLREIHHPNINRLKNSHFDLLPPSPFSTRSS
jgi:hypothetical protein